MLGPVYRVEIGPAPAVLADPAEPPCPVGFQNSVTLADQWIHAAASYSLISPPRIGRRLIRGCWGLWLASRLVEAAGAGLDVGGGGCSARCTSLPTASSAMLCSPSCRMRASW